MRIVIEQDGTTRLIDTPHIDPQALGAASKRRASNVLPRNRLLRAVFRQLRDTFGETGIIASFTRRWPCLWEVDLSPSCGPTIGPFRNRQIAIQEEVRWLEENHL